jgi:hypothetical protein
MAGSVKVEKFERDEIGGSVTVAVEIQTLTAQFTYPMRFPDKGSMSANERQACLELQKHSKKRWSLSGISWGKARLASPPMAEDRR